MSNSVQLYQEKGLTEEEARIVEKWHESGKPGIGRIKADFLSSIYNLGYTCQDINKMFPEFELPALLWSRVNFEWDKRRDEYRANLFGTVGQQAFDTKLETVQFLTEVARATHVKWRMQLMKYLAAPDREKAPAILADSIKEYKELAMLLKDLTEVSNPKNQPPGNVQGQHSVFINAPNATVSTANPDEVAKAMIEQMQMKTGKKGDG